MCTHDQPGRMFSATDSILHYGISLGGDENARRLWAVYTIGQIPRLEARIVWDLKIQVGDLAAAFERE